MSRHPASQLAGLFAVLLLPACGTDTLVDAAAETSALVTAQCDAQGNRAAVESCFAAFETCKSAEGADLAACKTTLDSCLPERLPRRGPPPGHDADGGCRGGEGHGHRGPPPGVEGLRGPPPGGLDGGPGRGGRGRGEGRGGGRGPVRPDDAAVQACQASVQSCVDAGTDAQTCRESARGCFHDALAAAFEGRCQELSAACAATPGADCSQITQRCAEGLREPPAPGVCSEEDAASP